MALLLEGKRGYLALFFYSRPSTIRFVPEGGGERQNEDGNSNNQGLAVRPLLVVSVIRACPALKF